MDSSAEPTDAPDGPIGQSIHATRSKCNGVAPREGEEDNTVQSGFVDALHNQADQVRLIGNICHGGVQ